MPIRIDRNTFRSYFEGKSIAVDEASMLPGLRESPPMQRALARAAGDDGVLQGAAEVDKLFGELDRWFNNDKPSSATGEHALYLRPEGATHRAVQALRVSTSLSRASAPAEAARQSLLNTTRQHRALLASRGVGTHYGDASAFAALDAAGKANYLGTKTKPGNSTPRASELTSSSCIGWTMEHVGAWYKAAGREARWAEVQRIVKQDNMTGTSLARELKNDGWKAYYNNPDTRFVAPNGDNEHSYSLHVAKTQSKYYGIPIDGMITDWASDASKLDVVKKAPFFVHVARGGYHVVAGTKGDVNEFARGDGPASTAIYQDPMANIVGAYGDMFGGGAAGRARAMHMWGSGVTLIPPST